jgi:hypothetical protein
MKVLYADLSVALLRKQERCYEERVMMMAMERTHNGAHMRSWVKTVPNKLIPRRIGIGSIM